MLLESDRFKQFLDHIPVAIAVSELGPSQAITYSNFEFERLTGQTAAKIQGNDWKTLPGVAVPSGDENLSGEAVQNDDEYIGSFTIDHEGKRVDVDAWSNTIESDEGVQCFALWRWRARETAAKAPANSMINCCGKKMSCFANCSMSSK